MLPSRRSGESTESSDDEGNFEGSLGGGISPNARPSRQDNVLQASTTEDRDEQRPAKRARTRGIHEFRGEEKIGESDLLMGPLQRFPTSSLPSQLARYQFSQGGMVPPDYFRAQPSGMSIFQQEQGGFQTRQQPYLHPGQHQQALLNPSLVSLLGSAHQLSQQIPTLNTAPRMMNPLLYSDRATLPTAAGFFQPISSMQGPQSAGLSGSSLPLPYYQPTRQIPSSFNLMRPFETHTGVSAQPPLDLSYLPFVGPGQSSVYHQNMLNLASLLPPQYPAEASANIGIGAETFSLPPDNRHASAPFHGGDTIPLELPVLLARPEDREKLSLHQILLRHQIEAFQASDDDVQTHTRGRNKPVTLGQVGIRCRHCKHLPVAKRQKGAAYFPATLSGLYQAAQNMSSTHMQCGLCSEMPMLIKQQFAMLMTTKASSSGAGRPYWADTAKKLGLVDTEDGIRFVRDVKPAALARDEPISDQKSEE